jgi:hypothetical protein
VRQLVYISDVAQSLFHDDLSQILDISRLNNRQSYVTGVLLTDGQQFLQALEGEAHAVSAILDRIVIDPRHSGVTILADREVSQREFGSWAMATNDDSENSFGGRVDSLVRGVTCAAIRAKFNNFADYVDCFPITASPREGGHQVGGMTAVMMAR